MISLESLKSRVRFVTQLTLQSLRPGEAIAATNIDNIFKKQGGYVSEK